MICMTPPNLQLTSTQVAQLVVKTIEIPVSFQITSFLMRRLVMQLVATLLRRKALHQLYPTTQVPHQLNLGRNSLIARLTLNSLGSETVTNAMIAM